MKRKEGQHPIDTKTPPSEASPVARIEALEERLAILEHVPLVARELSMHASFERKHAIEREQAQREAEDREQAVLQRTERFRDFVSGRLVLGAGRRTTCGHALKAYYECLDEAKAPRLERFHPAEFQTAILELDAVDSRLVSTQLGNPVAGLEGVAVAEEYRQDTDASQLEGEIARAHREAHDPDRNKGPDVPDAPELEPDAPPADVPAGVPVPAGT